MCLQPWRVGSIQVGIFHVLLFPRLFRVDHSTPLSGSTDCPIHSALLPRSPFHRLMSELKSLPSNEPRRDNVTPLIESGVVAAASDLWGFENVDKVFEIGGEQVTGTVVSL